MATPDVPSTVTFTPTRKPNPSLPTLLIFALPGNPGLIAYYSLFLSHLNTLLSSSPSVTSKVNLHIFGTSFAGFDVGPEAKRRQPVGVKEQIEFTKGVLESKVEEVRGNGGGNGDVKVVLMGHSFGAFVCLEVLRGLQGRVGERARIVGGMLLFPGVVGLQWSQNGQKFGPLKRIPSLPSLFQSLSALLTLLLPLSSHTRLLSYLTNFPSYPSLVTTLFLRSPSGVRQALTMAAEELDVIDQDTWGAEIWGAADVVPHARLWFLWGKEDHWVKSELRDELIRKRARMRGAEEGKGDGSGGETWRPRMEVDGTEGWEHSFCIHSSEPVAERVSGYVEELIGEVF